MLSNRKSLIIAGVFTAAGVLLLILTSSVLNKSSYDAPESNFIPSGAPATLLSAGELYRNIEINQYEQLRKDLTNYARNYKNSGDEIITYELVGPVNINNDLIVFDLESKNKPEHQISVSLERKPYQRISLSFVDKKLNSSEFDSSLESNSKRNQYVATLPIQRDNYTIDFNQQEDKFLIQLYVKDSSLIELALKEIYTGTEIGSLKPSDYDITVPGVFEDPGFGEPVDGIEGD